METFWNTLPYSKYPEWKTEDLSDSIKRKTIITLNCIPRTI